MTRAKFFAFACVATGVAAYALGIGGWPGVAVGIGVPLVVVLAPGFLVGTITGARTPAARERAATATAQLSGTEFENYVAQVARTCGVPVIMTPLSGDWGVDLIVGNRPDRLAIQCKRLGRPVGPGAVQEVVTGAPMQGCSKTMVVSNQGFTPAARRLAELHGCALVGGSELAQLRSAIRQALS